MAIISLIAAIECEGCGKHFRVAVETGDFVPEGWDLPDIIKDAVRGGDVVPERGQPVTLGSCSVQDDKMLCIACTDKADAESDESDD